MTSFELTYLAIEPLLPVLPRLVRRHVKQVAAGYSCPPMILDVGGRKSHYTIGVPGRVTISDLSRESPLQRQLNLGLDDTIVNQTMQRRSNIERVVFDDMTRSALPDKTFDIVIAIEVLEHVAEDTRFIESVHRVLKPGGRFIMSTPNGDWMPIPHNPDHKRHYSRASLVGLLESRLQAVDVKYCVKMTRYSVWGLQSWTTRRPVRTVRGMAANVVNWCESSRQSLREQSTGTGHLFATARRT